MKQKVYVMIGKIGSGKTSWARMVAETDFNVIRVGADDIRSMIKKGYTFDLQLEPLVDRIKFGAIFQILDSGKNIVIDDCHLSKSRREELCEKIKSYFQEKVEITYVWMQCDDKVALSRRLQNIRGRSEFEWKQVAKKHDEEFTAPAVSTNKRPPTY